MLNLLSCVMGTCLCIPKMLASLVILNLVLCEVNIEAGPDIHWDSEVLVLLLQSLTRSLRTLR